jgi:tRNA threonylcarbamoyladenosine biosynthesis protein TsaE
VEAAAVADPSASHHSIRGAELSDAAVIADLVRLAFAVQSRPTNPPSSALKETAATITDHLARGGGAVLESGGAIVGVVLWAEEDDALYIGRLSVDTEQRRQGIARALMDEAER